MSRLAAFAALFAFAFLGGGLLAPWVWWGAQALAATGVDGGWAALARQPFHRYVHRCLLLLAVLGCWPLARNLQLRSFRDLGFDLDGRPAIRRQARDLLSGGTVALVMFVALLGLELAADLRRWREGCTAGVLLEATVQATFTGLAVGPLEEVLFRAVLCGGLQRSLGWNRAIFVTSAVYAALHLFRRPPPPPIVGFGSGLHSVAEMLAGLTDPAAWFPGGATLFVAGLLLAGWYRETGRLAGPIGLHAGWVVSSKLRAAMTQPPPNADSGSLASADGGWTLLGLTVAALAILWGMTRTKKRSPEKPQPLRVSRRTAAAEKSEFGE